MYSLSFLDQYIVAVNASIAVVDAWYFNKLNNRVVANIQVVNQIEQSMNDTYDIVMAHFNKQMITMRRIYTMSTMQKCLYNSNNMTMDTNNSSNGHNNVKNNRND